MRSRRWLVLAALACATCTEPELQLPPPRPRGELDTGPVLGPQKGRARQSPPRAFVIDSDADLVAGAEADGKLGDLRLENSKAVFIIDSPGSALGFADSGGNLIDAVPAGGCRGGCRDALKQIFGYLDDSFPRQPIYDRVEPGQKSDSAWVHAYGHDSDDPSLAIETEYILKADWNALEILTRVTNRGSKTVSSYEIGDAIQWGRAQRFAPGAGFDRPGRDAIPGGWIAGLADDVTYAYVADTPDGLRGSHGGAWSDLNLQTVELPPGAQATCRRWLVVVGAHDAEDTLGESIARLRRESWPRVEGRILEELSGAPLEGARVFLDTPAGVKMSFAISTPTGRYVAVVPPGDYQLRTQGRGRRGQSGLDVTLRAGDKRTMDLQLSRPGALRFTVTEGGTPTPAKLTFLGGPDGRAPHLGPYFEAPGGNVALTVDGKGRVDLPPGRYQVQASRGPDFTLDTKMVEIVAGDEAVVAFELQRVVDPRGYVCVDLHQHASPSPDSGVSLRDRAASNLAEGLEVMVATDHDAIGDWQPVVDALSATRPLRVIAGDEATHDGLGHWNAYPLTFQPGQPRGGAPDVRTLDARGILAGLRSADNAADRIVQVNHPRAGKLMGYFDTVKLDPRPGVPLPADFQGGFDAIEIFSSKDVSLADAPMRDWFALLDRGLEYTGVGGSDSHLIYGWEVGYPRSCIAVVDPTDQKALPQALVDGIKRKRDVLVTNGPFVRVAVAGHGMGQLAPAPRGKARLDVEVTAAPWVDTRRLEVIVNGERRGKPLDLPQPAAGAPLRWKGSIELKLAEDSWVVVVVRGDTALPVLARLPGAPPPLPLAITNPIFLDRDLDGKYLAPRAARPAEHLK